MSSVWGMIRQWRSTIKVSTELPVATRHRRDMTEQLLKATLNPNKQQQQQHKGCAHYTGHSRHTNQTLRFYPHVLSSSELRDREIMGLNPCWDIYPVYHLTERHTRRLTYIASDVRDRVRNRGQDNVININTGSGVRRIILIQYLRDSNVCIKVNNGILMKICWPQMPAHAHTRYYN